MSIVVCRLPKAGLGNQLFPLLHAAVFARLNQLPLMVTGYHQLKIGPYLRREKNKRQYANYFKFQKSVLGEWFDKRKIKNLEKKWETVFEPAVDKISEGLKQNKIFVFDKMTTYHDYFKHLKGHRELAIELLNELINPVLKKKLNDPDKEYISMHMRMGDFRKLQAGESYNSGHVRTPASFFIENLQAIRQLQGKNLEAIIFTDGRPEELKEILQMPNVTLAAPNPDIIDLFLLSKGKIIIGTHGSTYSAWACFLSESPYISYFDHVVSLRPAALNTIVYEGKFDLQNELLLRNIKER